MTIREWCERTNNVFNDSTMLRIYQTSKLPIWVVAGSIPDELARREMKWATVTRINPDNMSFQEVKVKVYD